MSFNIFIQMEISFLLIIHFFHQLINWSSLVICNSVEPKVFDNLPNIQFHFFNIDIDNLCDPQKNPKKTLLARY
jgi:hypothetical protein